MSETELEKEYKDYFNNFGKDFDFIRMKNFLNCGHKFSLKEIVVKLNLDKGKSNERSMVN